MIIYLLTFYLFDDIEKITGITYANHSATPKTILTKVHDCTCNLLKKYEVNKHIRVLDIAKNKSVLISGIAEIRS